MGGILTIEWVQLTAAAIGVGVSIYAVSLAQRDIWRNAIRSGNMIDDTVGRIRRRRETMRVLKHLGLLVGGWVITDWRVHNAAFLQTVADFVGTRDFTYLMSYYTARVTMMYVSVMTCTETIWERYDRYVIERLSEAEFDRRIAVDRWQEQHQARRIGDMDTTATPDSDARDRARDDDRAS